MTLSYKVKKVYISDVHFQHCSNRPIILPYFITFNISINIISLQKGNSGARAP